MFRRRRPRPLPSRLAGIVWPRGGWRRVVGYRFHRLKRLPGSPHAIAAGVASGAAVSCTPLPGVHFLLGFLLAYTLRGGLLASALGTAFGNPWTFPVLWGAAHRVGTVLMPGVAGETPADTSTAMDALLGLDLAALTDAMLPVWQTAMIGSLPLGVLVWLAVYLPVRSAVTAARARRGPQRLPLSQEP